MIGLHSNGRNSSAMANRGSFQPIGNMQTGTVQLSPGGSRTLECGSGKPYFQVGDLVLPPPRQFALSGFSRLICQLVAKELIFVRSFGELILRKIIIEIVDTRCKVLRLKCTKFDFAGGALPDPLAGFHVSYL